MQTSADSLDRRDRYYEERLRHPQPYTDFDPAATRLVLQFLYGYDVLESRLIPRLSAHGLSLSAFNILMVLRHYGTRGLPLHEIGELLLVSRANVTGVVDGLESNGWVRRVAEPADRRIRLAVITDEGLALLERVLPEHYRWVRQALTGLSEQERTTLTELLIKMRHSIERSQR